MRKSAVVNIVGIVVLCSVLSGCASPERSAEQAYQEGLRLKERGEFSLALEHFRTALTYAPQYADAYLELGVLACRSRNYPYAVKQLLRAIEYGSESYKAYAYLGFAYEQAGSLTIAENYYRQALHRAPTLTDVPLRLVDILESQGRRGEAAEILQTLLKKYPNLEQADVLKARMTLLYAPDNVDAHLVMADVYVRRGEIEHGLAEYQSAAPLQPEQPETIAAFGMFCADREQWECAVTYLKQALDLNLANPLKAYQVLADCYERLGNLPAALAEYQDILRLQPMSAEVRLKIADLLEQTGRQADAAELLETGFYRGLLTNDANTLWSKILQLRGETTTKAVVRLKQWGQYNLVDVMIADSVKATLLFDPSAEYAIISEELAQKLNILLSTSTSEVHFFFNGQQLRAPLVNLASLKVGAIEVRNVPALIWDFSEVPNIDGVLGKSFLKHFQVDMQPQHQLVILTKLFS